MHTYIPQPYLVHFCGALQAVAQERQDYKTSPYTPIQVHENYWYVMYMRHKVIIGNSYHPVSITIISTYNNFYIIILGILTLYIVQASSRTRPHNSNDSMVDKETSKHVYLCNQLVPSAVTKDWKAINHFCVFMAFAYK